MKNWPQEGPLASLTSFFSPLLVVRGGRPLFMISSLSPLTKLPLVLFEANKRLMTNYLIPLSLIKVSTGIPRVTTMETLPP